MPLMTWLPKQEVGWLRSDETHHVKRSGVWRGLSNKRLHFTSRPAPKVRRDVGSREMTPSSISLGTTGQSLEQKMPDVYRQLLDVRDCLEKHFRDVCDIEFTIQEGRLFILSARPAKRAPLANLKFLLQFLSEGKIGMCEVLSRVRLADVESTCIPQIHNLTSLLYLGRGLPACAGSATGEIAFDSSGALRLAHQGRKFVLVKEEVNPEDVAAVLAAQGVLTARGGMTSHAALVCRGWGKPSVVGFGQMQFRPRQGIVVVADHGSFEAGKWITIDGATGRVYAGKGDVSIVNWRDQSELFALAQIIELAIKTEDVPTDAVGSVWKLRDFFVYNTPLSRSSTFKRATKKHTYVAFNKPTRRTLQLTRANLTHIRREEQENYSLILMSMADTLSRLLSSSLGVGNHHRYFRPLWDPKCTVLRRDEAQATQMIGFEFFGINRHIPHLVDVATMTFMFDLELRGEQDEWFLDVTNSRGESLVAGSGRATACELRLNDARVAYDDIPLLFHRLRRREYEWRVYQSSGTSHADIIAFLLSWSKGSSQDHRLIPICFELGLLRGSGLTLAGESLVGRCPRNHRYEYA